MLDPLSKLAIRHGTDKFGYHDYTPNYHKLFNSLRDDPLKFLEIGVGGDQDADRGGQSLATWRDYFPQAEITGIDIQLKTLDLGPRVEILRGSQVDEEFLGKMAKERGPFDIILDDGSHRNEHVVESFELLWPGLKPGGIYVIENVQTSFIPRFGGSLTLDHPNSVGYFAEIFLRMGHAHDDPLVGDVGRIERFHNIVALKKIAAGAAESCAGSNLLDRLGEDRTIAAIGTTADPAVWGARAAQVVASPDAIGNANIVLLGVDAQDEDTLLAAFDKLALPGVLVIEGDIGPVHPLAETLMRIWTEVDHREIRVHFPDAPIAETSKWIFSLEKHPDGVMLHKALNDYPSNFAFDPNQPQAAAAIAAIEAELQDCDEENGLVQFAGMLTTLHGREAAAHLVERLTRIGGTSRGYYQLAGGLAQRERRFEEAADLFRSALAAFPADPQFTLGFGTVLLALNELDEAADAIFEAREAHPRSAVLMLLHARVKARQGDMAGAIATARESIDASASPNRKQPAQIALAELLATAGETDDARDVLTELIAGGGAATGRACRLLSRIEHGAGNDTAALEAIESALKHNPSHREYQKWRDSLVTRLG